MAQEQDLEAILNSHEQRKRKSVTHSGFMSPGSLHALAVLGGAAFVDTLTTVLGFSCGNIEESNPFVAKLIDQRGLAEGLALSYTLEMGIAALLLKVTEKVRTVGGLVRGGTYLLSLYQLASAAGNFMGAKMLCTGQHYSPLESIYINILNGVNQFW